MSSFINQLNKVLFADQFNVLHNTFARPISIYRNAEQIVINTNPANNFLFQGENVPFNDTVKDIPVSGVFNARIRYNTKQDLEMFAGLGGRKQGGEQINIQQSKGVVRIKVDPTGSTYLFGANRITFDGTIFTLRSDQRPHGLFIPNFYDFFLQKED